MPSLAWAALQPRGSLLPKKCLRESRWERGICCKGARYIDFVAVVESRQIFFLHLFAWPSRYCCCSKNEKPILKKFEENGFRFWILETDSRPGRKDGSLLFLLNCRIVLKNRPPKNVISSRPVSWISVLKDYLPLLCKYSFLDWPLAKPSILPITVRVKSFRPSPVYIKQAEIQSDCVCIELFIESKIYTKLLVVDYRSCSLLMPKRLNWKELWPQLKSCVFHVNIDVAKRLSFSAILCLNLRNLPTSSS